MNVEYPMSNVEVFKTLRYSLFELGKRVLDILIKN
jgi:hypothetical protein